MRNLATLFGILLLPFFLLAQNTFVFFQNNTYDPFTVSSTMTGGLSGSDWTGMNGTIDSLQRETQLLSFKRILGFQTSPKIYFLTTTITGPGGAQIDIKIELTEGFGTTTFQHSASGPGFSEPWRNNRNIYTVPFTMNGNNYLLRYQSYSTAPAGVYDDVLFAVYHDPDPAFYSIPGADSTDPNVLNVLTYNLYMRPTTLFPNDAQAERALHIPNYIHDFDVVIFQEAFDNPIRDDLKQYLQAEYPYQSSVVGNPNNILEDGGCFVASKWPINLDEQLLWGTTCWDVDCSSNKGVKYVSINKLGRNYHLFDTHMDAFNAPQDIATRKAQLEMWKHYIDSMNIPLNEGVIMGGDFNIDRFTNKAGEYDSIWGNYGAQMPIYQGWYSTWDSDYNFLLKDASDPPEYLDYLVNSTDHAQALYAMNEVLMLRSNHIDMWRVFDLSDHQAVWGRFEFASQVAVDPELADLQWQVFPNPLGDGQAFHIEMELDQAMPVRIEAVNLLGQVVWRQEENGIPGHNRFVAETSHWEKGLYALRVMTAFGEFSRKVVKQ